MAKQPRQAGSEEEEGRGDRHTGKRREGGRKKEERNERTKR